MAKEKEEGKEHGCCFCGGKGYFWGVALLVAGFLFLLRDLGYIVGVSFWTILLIVLGIFLLVPKKCGCK
jgi:membrane-bound ClpP family serine protease